MATEQALAEFLLQGVCVAHQTGSSIAMKIAELGGGWRRKSGEPPQGEEADAGHMNISGRHLKIRVRLGTTKTLGGDKCLMKKVLFGAV